MNKQQNSEIEFYNDKELVCAVIEGRLSYKKFQKQIGNSLCAARIYAANVPNLFLSSPDGICNVCRKSGKKITLNWGARLNGKFSDWSVGKFVELPFLLLAYIFFALTITTIDDSEKISFSTIHTLCNRCKPSFSRNAIGLLFSFVYCIFVLALLSLLIVVIFFCTAAFTSGDSLDIIFGILLAFCAIAIFSALIFFIRIHRKLDMAIRLPEHFRIIARGPFDLLKAGKIK